jgi:hypothetical protein
MQYKAVSRAVVKDRIAQSYFSNEKAAMEWAGAIANKHGVEVDVFSISEEHIVTFRPTVKKEQSS